ncbi:MAG: STAS domain-containing protein [Lachnospiraceae bacterium]|nr:STAS domain-containing protein [Lachnospiraceae bacterium]
MEAIITKEEGKALAVITGRLDTVTSEELRKQLEGAEIEGLDLELDFTQVEYISSAGLRLLVALQKKAMTSGSRLTVKNINRVVEEVFKVSGLGKAITVI